MKIRTALFVQAPKAAVARDRFLSLGGEPAAVGNFVEGFSILISTDNKFGDKSLLESLAQDLGAEAVLSRSVLFEDEDYETAELLYPQVGDIDEPFGRSFPSAASKCSHCGRLRWNTISEPTLRKKTAYNYDIFLSDYGTVVSERVKIELESLSGLVTFPIKTTPPHSSYYLLQAASSLGYPVLDYEWSEPCQVCGRRQGSPIGPIVLGWKRYPRIAWQGEDFIGTELGELFVSKRAWSILANLEWRVPKNNRHTNPVLLVQDAEPVR